MAINDSFFSTANSKQIVNQWICIAFICVLCFWTVLYYITEQASIVAESYASTNVAGLDY